MRILLVQDTDWFERGPHQQHHLMEKLSLRAHEIHVVDHELLWMNHSREELISKRQVFNNVSKINKEAKITVFRPSFVRIPHLDYVSLLFSFWREINRQIKEFKPDVVVGLYLLSSYMGMKLAKKYRIPFIYYLLEAQHKFVPVKLYQPIAKMIERRILKSADKVLVLNDTLADYAIRMGADPKRTSVVSGGVYLERFNINNECRHIIRQQYAIKEDDLVLFFMGWLYTFSGLKEVALELAKVKNDYPQIKILIVGEGDLKPALQRIQQEHSLCQLIFAGKQPYEKIPEFIAASDICLLPAHNNDVMRDIVPIKTYEYMACGRPVICTRLHGIMKEFGHHNGVIYVDRPRDVLGKAIELMNNPKFIQQYGNKARKFVERYGWDEITNEFEAILETLTCKVLDP